MLDLNRLIVIGISVILLENTVTATVAYIFRRDNGGQAKVLKIGPNQGQFVPSKLLNEPWNRNNIAAYNFNPSQINNIGYKPITTAANNVRVLYNPAAVKVKDNLKYPSPQPFQALRQAFYNAGKLSKIKQKQYTNQYPERTVQLAPNFQQLSLPLSEPSQVKLIKLQSTYQAPHKAGIIIKPASEDRDDDGKDMEQSSKKYIEVNDLVIREYSGNDDNKENPVNKDSESNGYDNDNNNQEDANYDNNDNHKSKHGKRYHDKIGKHHKIAHGGIKYHKKGHIDSDENDHGYEDDDKVSHEKHRTSQDETLSHKDGKKAEADDKKVGHEKGVDKFDEKLFYDYDKSKPYSSKFYDYFGDKNFEYDGKEDKYDYLKDDYDKDDFKLDKEEFGLSFKENGDEDKSWNKFDKYAQKEESGNKNDGNKFQSKGKKGKKKFYVVKQYTTGYHNQWNKDEFKKDHDFYDDADKSGDFSKGGKEEEHHDHKEGAHNHKEKNGSSSDGGKYGSGEADKGKEIHDAGHHKYSNSKGDEKKYKDNNAFSNKEGKSKGKKYAYGEEEGKE